MTAQVTASVSYWASGLNPDGRVAEWFWRCEDCGALGVVATEEEAIRVVDEHVASHDQ